MEKKIYSEYENKYRSKISEYYQLRDWDGLLHYLQALDTHGVLNTQWKWQIGQALVLNNKPQEAIDYLFHLHSFFPEQPDIQSAILDALEKAGKTLEDFCWLCKPRLEKIEEKFLLRCLHFIQKARKETPIYILHAALSARQSVEFDEFDLLQALKRDPRFQVLNETPFFRYSKINLTPAGYRNLA